MQLIGSSPVVIRESVGNATYMADTVETKQSSFEDKYNEYQCSAACQRIILPMIEICLYVRSNAQGVQMVTLNEKLIKNLQAHVTQDVVDVDPTQHFLIKMEN